tara:strand:+ start:903 stop:1055 length:153 start_codon:yes stop_codon:yes gene_type:complete
MLYISLDGKLVEIKRDMFSSDENYYKHILKIKKNMPKEKNMMRNLERIIK